jgi:hypothetical protein
MLWNGCSKKLKSFCQRFENIMHFDMICLCGLVVIVPGCRSRWSGFDCQRYQIFWVAVVLERGPLSLMSITEELLEREVAALL